MRLCRFRLDDTILTGFYTEERVFPLDQAAEVYAEATDNDLFVPTTDTLLDLLPPDGESFDAVRILSEWIQGLPAAELDELAIPIEDVELLTPIAAPSKILLLAGNYAAHVVERGGVAAERGDVPLRLHEAADDDPQQPRRSDRDPERVAESRRLGVRTRRRDRSNVSERR